jgi:hypothetical protein
LGKSLRANYKQFDWLATNIDDITSQSDSLLLVGAKKLHLPSGERALAIYTMIYTVLC